MEGHDHLNANIVVLLDQQHVQGGSARAGDGTSPGSTSRWNPTKEQINMLESFYRQGIRTPGAEQIQQITSRLRAYGHIEGKNVFYWFQNHKARQRQKQKQESMAYLNPIFHRRTAHPIFPLPPPPYNPSLYPNVMCRPYYIPVQSEVGFYQQPQYPNKVVPLSVGAKRKPRTEKSVKPRTTRTGGSGYEPMHHGYTSGGCYSEGDMIGDATNTLINNRGHETLPLFPLQPTEILQATEDENPPLGSSTTANNYAHSSTTALIGSSEIAAGDHPFYDFFSG